MLEIRLLGQFDLRRGGARIEIPSRPAQSLLAYLLLNQGVAHRREKLAGLLWPDSTETNARSYLRKALWQIRKSLARAPQNEQDFLSVDDIAIAFNAEADHWVDAAALEEQPPEGGSVEELAEIVSLYQGELLPGFYEEWVGLERERLQAIFERRIELLLDRLLEQGRWAEALEWAERWIALGSKPEPAYRGLMSAHAAMGNKSKVAAAYERCVQTLREELDVEPSEHTVDLYQQLRAGAAAPSRSPATAAESVSPVEPAAPSTDRIPDHRETNLPIPLTSFIGREAEIAEIVRLLEDSRLLTLIGAGGSGKTRLAIQVAGEMQSQFPEGVWWIEFASLADPALVPQSVAKVLGVRELPEQTLSETLAAALRERQLLLAFDSCEHLVDACARQAEQLLQTCPALKILATSRELMGISGEQSFQVPPLSSPDPDVVPTVEFAAYDAVRLFVERAASLKSDFALTDQNALAVGQLCHGLDGIPLAIELAAARVFALRVEQIAARLDDRFRLLTGGSRTALPRHQTLRATIDWSYDLLSKPERTALRRLSVFTGGWTAGAAETICASGSIKPRMILDLLSQLVSKSLLIADRRPGEEARYRMLETIREYAGGKLAEAGETAALRDRHLQYYVALAEEAEPQLFSPEQVLWLNRLEAEHDNLRAAVAWSLESMAAAYALRLVGALSWFWSTRGHYREAGELSLEILSSPLAAERTAARAKALSMAGLVQWVLGRKADVRPLLEEAIDISTEIRDQVNTAWSRVFLGAFISSRGDYTEGQPLIEQGLEECRALGSAGRHGVGFALSFLGDGAFYEGDYERAHELYGKSVDVLREVREYNFLAYSLRRVGHTARYLGDLESAVSGCLESLSLNRELGHKQAVAACVTGLASIGLARGEALAAAQLFGAVEAELEVIGVSLLPSDTVEYERSVALARDELGEDRFAAAWSAGRKISIGQAIFQASELAASKE